MRYFSDHDYEVVAFEGPGQGIIEFNPGFYAYIGSALNTMEKRIRRHLFSNKKLFWHIDYLLNKTEIVDVFKIESGHKLVTSVRNIGGRSINNKINFIRKEIL